MDKNKTLIFNTQRYSVHDGPGIRTIIFLKGCPLYCPWCANPEGQKYKKELLHNPNLCKKCGMCVNSCSKNAITLENGILNINRNICDCCGDCKNICPSDAFKLFGESKTCDEILKDVVKDEIFFNRSGGGMTISGGEPLSHIDFLEELLEKAKNIYHLHTAIETTCFAPEYNLRRVIDNIDYFLCDIKLINNDRHKNIIGASNNDILNNIKIISNEYINKDLILRMPVIPGFNDDEENINDISKFINTLKRKIPIELLPFHQFGKSKYSGLGMTYCPELTNIDPPSKEHMDMIENLFIKNGITTIHT